MEVRFRWETFYYDYDVERFKNPSSTACNQAF